MSSWPMLLAVFVVLGAIGASLALRLEHSARAQAIDAAVQDAGFVALPTVGFGLRGWTHGDSLTRGQTRTLDATVRSYKASGQLDGLAIYDHGLLLYRSGDQVGTVNPEQLTRAGDGTAQAWMSGSDGITVLVSASAELPPLATATAQGQPGGAKPDTLPVSGEMTRDPDLVVAVALPTGPVFANARRTAAELIAAITLLLALVVASLIALGRQLRLRHFQAMHDHMTNLGNRALLERSGPELLSSGEGAMVLLDLDNFKQVNDTMGHAAGDQLLVQVASALRSTMRGDDLLFRLGGDEFAAILVGHDAASAQLTAERLRSSINRPFMVDGHRVDVDASVGTSLAPLHGETVGELLQAADIAMYEAKRGRLGVCQFESSRHTLLLPPAVAVAPGA